MAQAPRSRSPHPQACLSLDRRSPHTVPCCLSSSLSILLFVSYVGEGPAAVLVIRKCVEWKPVLNICYSTTSVWFFTSFTLYSFHCGIRRSAGFLIKEGREKEGRVVGGAITVEVMKYQLPSGVIYQFAPLDAPFAMDAFLAYWKPSAIILVESELWPKLTSSASRMGKLVRHYWKSMDVAGDSSLYIGLGSWITVYLSFFGSLTQQSFMENHG